MLAVVVVVIILLAAGGAYYYYSTLPTTPSTTSMTSSMMTSAPMVSTSSPTLSGSITVAAEAGYSDSALKQIAKDFMAQYPGTTVNVVLVAYDTALTDYTTAFSANQSVYDVMIVPNVGYLGPLSQYLLNFEPYLSNTAYFPASYNYSDIIPSLLSPFTIQGNLYGLPYSSDTMLFFYRPSYFNSVTNQQAFQAQYGYALPNPANTTFTVQQLVDVANFFNGKHGAKYGIIEMTGPGDDDMLDSIIQLYSGVRTANSATYGPVAAPYGALFTANGQILTNTTSFQTTMAAFVQLIKASENPLTASFESVTGTFASGDAPMFIYWSTPVFVLGNSTSSSIVNDWAVAPTMPGGVSNNGGEALSIFKYTRNLPLALAFAAFATNPTESINYMKLNSLLPARYSGFSYATQYLGLSQQIVKIFLSNLASSVQGVSNVPYWPQISTYIRGEVPSIYSGSVTVAQGCSVITSESVQAGATAYTDG